MTTPTPPFDPTSLRLGADLRRLGIEPSDTGSDWHVIRRGIWLPSRVWNSLDQNQRYRALGHATLMAMRDPEAVTLAGESAAAFWELPRLEPWPDHITVLDPTRKMGPSRFIRPRFGDPVEAVERHGLLVTPAARTVIDIACTGTLQTAVAAADHALARGLCTPEELLAEYASLARRAIGRGAARFVVDFADPLSGSPGESLSRLQMFRANFARPVLQAEYRDELGIMRPDFDLGPILGEFDGKLKYRVPEGASAEEAGEVVWREKQREDRLRRFKPVGRWVWSTARTEGALARLLMSMGLRPLPKSTWFDLGDRRSAS